MNRHFRVAEGSVSVPARGGSVKKRHRELFYKALENRDPVGALEILQMKKEHARSITYSQAEARELVLDLSCVVIDALSTIKKEERHLWCVAGLAVEQMRRLLARNVVLHDAASQALATVRKKLEHI